MKKLTFTHVFLSMAYVFVLIQSLRAMYQLLLFCGAFLYQLIKHEDNGKN
jgi:hypothetical protein